MTNQEKKLITLLHTLMPRAYAFEIFAMMLNDDFTVEQIENRLKEIFPPESERE